MVGWLDDFIKSDDFVSLWRGQFPGYHNKNVSRHGVTWRNEGVTVHGEHPVAAAMVQMEWLEPDMDEYELSHTQFVAMVPYVTELAPPPILAPDIDRPPGGPFDQ